MYDATKLGKLSQPLIRALLVYLEHRPIVIALYLYPSAERRAAVSHGTVHYRFH